MNQRTPSQHPFWSYGFRPFFLGASMFAGLAVPTWIMLLAEGSNLSFQFSPREWHVHEMVFGFLPGVIAGFVLTAMPNWTDRPPLSGYALMSVFSVWLAGRLSMACPWIAGIAAAIIDCAFLLIIAGIAWREIIAGKVWDRTPIGVLMTLYAAANILFHVDYMSGTETDLASRMALGLLMILLTLIGGRITPGFTEDVLEETCCNKKISEFSPFDGLAIIFTLAGVISWIIFPNHAATGWILIAGGLAHLIRLGRWYGWVTWREPLVLILHIGYGWLAISFCILGSAILGIGLPNEDAVHALTTGAVGSMTMGVMTRASLGHTGRPKHAGAMTVVVYLLVNLGAILRVLTSHLNMETSIMLGMATLCWSGAYLIFSGVYSPILLGANLEEN